MSYWLEILFWVDSSMVLVIYYHRAYIRIASVSSWIQSPLPTFGHIFKWTYPGLFLFIFVLFKHKFYRKNCRLQQDLNSDRWSRRRGRWPLDHHHHGQILFGHILFDHRRYVANFCFYRFVMNLLLSARQRSSLSSSSTRRQKMNNNDKK